MVSFILKLNFRILITLFSGIKVNHETQQLLWLDFGSFQQPQLAIHEREVRTWRQTIFYSLPITNCACEYVSQM